MDWNQLTELPFFWIPFSRCLSRCWPSWRCRTARLHSQRRDVQAPRRGVYFAIITQALAAVMTILIVGRQGYTGGINGITDLRTLLGWDIRPTTPNTFSTSSAAGCCSA